MKFIDLRSLQLAVRKEFLIIATVTIIVQVLFAIPVFLNINRALLPFTDAIRYDRLANNLIDEHTYSRDTVPPFRPESFVPPGYPVFIAFFYSIFGRSLIPIILGQLILSCIIGILVFLFAEKFTQNRKIALFSGILFGLSPNIAFHSTKLISESLFTFLLFLSLYLLLLELKKPPEIFQTSNSATPYRLLIAGFFFGLATYVRTIAIYFPILILIALSIFYRKYHFRFKDIFLFITIYFILLFPWLIRNASIFKRPVFATTAEVNIFLYNAPTVIASKKNISLVAARETIWSEVKRLFIQNPNLDTVNEVIRAQIGARVGLKYIFRSPFTYAKIHLTSFLLNFIVPIGISPLIQYLTGKPLTEIGLRPRVMQDALAFVAKGKISQALNLVIKERFHNLSPIGFIILFWAAFFQLFIMIGAIISLWYNFKKVFILLLPILYFTLTTGPVCDARLRMPIEPLLIMLATIGYFSFKRSNESIKSKG